MPESGEEHAPWSIRRVLEWAAADFRKRGLDSPRLDAEILLARALRVDRMRLILDAHRPLEKAELDAYRVLIQRRRRAEPVAYILGEREFYGLPFEVDRRVLVPRPDTEALVDTALDRTKKYALFGRALDLCTGSGCVAIAFARHRPTWQVTGVDISSDCVELARRNALRLGAVPNLRLIASDLDEALGSEDRFDLVTANPPYVPHGDIPGLPADIRDHEPRVALDGGADGLDVVRRVISVARTRVSGGGVLAIEVGAGQAARTAELVSLAGFSEVELRRDYGGVDRVVSARLVTAT